MGSGPAAAIVKEFHTAQTTVVCIITTNIAPITVLKVPQRSSCVDLQNCESLDAVGDRTHPHTPLKVSVQLIRHPSHLHAPSLQITRRHALADIIHISPCLHRCWRHLLASTTDVILWLWVFDRWLLKVDRWLWTSVDFDHWLFSKGWLFQSKFFLPNFLRRFHFCSLFLHIVSLNE